MAAGAVRIAVIDSGIDPGHPGVRGRARITDTVSIDAHGFVRPEPAARDDLGHGTAVAATLLAHTPQREHGQLGLVELVLVRVFGHDAQCSPAQLAAALDYAAEQRVHLVNASLGITDPSARACLEPAVARLLARGCRLMAPATSLGLPCLPGSLDGVDRVVADPNLASGPPVQREHAGRTYWFASPLPPTGMPGMPRSRIRGESLAVANVTGHLAARAITTSQLRDG